MSQNPAAAAARLAAAAGRRTLLDRVIGVVSPEAGLRRATARARLHAVDAMASSLGAAASLSESAGTGGSGGYSTTNGSDGWFSRWSTAPRSAAADTLAQLPTQRGQSRDLVRNHPLAASAINTNCVRAVGTGLALSAMPHAATLGWTPEQALAWRTGVQAEFSLWADSPACDWWGQETFYALQDLVLRSMLESGDVFSLLPQAAPTPMQPYGLRVQVIEADRIGNPMGQADTAQMSGGVRRTGTLVDYHLYDNHPGETLLRAARGKGLLRGQWVAARGDSGRHRMLHVYKALRPEQPRGVPYLAPVMGLFKQLGTYTDAEIKAAVVSAFVSLIIETPGGTGTAPVFGVPAPGQQPAPGQPTAQGPAGTDIALGPAAVLGLAPGEKATEFNPMRPNPSFSGFVDAVCTQLGAGTFIGGEMLLKRYNTSYVAARAAFLDAWKHLLDMRTLLARKFCQPVYETWLAEAVFLGRVQAPGFFTDPLRRWAYTRAAWQGDSQGSINPKDEIAAYGDAVDRRLMTRERASWELFGSDWQDQYPTMLAEHQRLAADGMQPVPKAGAPAPQPAPPAAA